MVKSRRHAISFSKKKKSHHEKAISTIVATVLILVLTIGMGGAAYVFISGTFSSKTATSFELLDAVEDTVTIRNTGTGLISTITANLDGKSVNIPLPSSVAAGQTAPISPYSSTQALQIRQGWNLIGPTVERLSRGTHTLKLCTSSICNTAILTIRKEYLAEDFLKYLNSQFVPSGDQLILIRRNSGSGTGTISSSGTAITGTGTLFTTELSVGGNITASLQERKITAIQSPTSLTVTPAFSPDVTDSAFSIVEYHSLGSSAFNFPIKVGEGYFVNSRATGTTSLSGTSGSLSAITIQAGYPWISFPQVPASIDDSEELLQAMSQQGIDVAWIARWDTLRGRYNVSSGVNKLDIIPGEGYVIRSSTSGTFQIPAQ
ncbi:MAG: hypothetical protein HYW24_04465 [Candidatus Aenigmarchaeota archaeon]|nr:hypothetical protein [Candidatus Aenigmarchaeota archaeon]